LPAPEPFPKTGFQITIEKTSPDDLPRFELEQAGDIMLSQIDKSSESLVSK
jgi:hypothetical protein